MIKNNITAQKATEKQGPPDNKKSTGGIDKHTNESLANRTKQQKNKKHKKKAKNKMKENKKRQKERQGNITTRTNKILQEGRKKEMKRTQQKKGDGNKINKK